LFLDPSIPPQLTNGIQVKGLHHQGAVFDISIYPNTTVVARRPDPAHGHRSAAKVQTPNESFTLLPGTSREIKTRRPDLNGTDIPNNLAECKPAYSTSRYQPGQFPVSAVDGSNHTNWSPETDEPAELFVNLGEPKTFSKLSINWAQWPPLKFAVLTEGGDEVWSQDEVEISEPWSEEDALIVKMRKGNQTEVDLGRSWSEQVIRLRIEGDRSGKGKGATVAQFAVLP